MEVRSKVWWIHCIGRKRKNLQEASSFTYLYLSPSTTTDNSYIYLTYLPDRDMRWYLPKRLEARNQPALIFSLFLGQLTTYDLRMIPGVAGCLSFPIDPQNHG